MTEQSTWNATLNLIGTQKQLFLDDADNLASTGFANVVTWNGSPDVGALAGKPIRLKVYSKNVKLFAFQFAE